jgi:hypothetical protein
LPERPKDASEAILLDAISSRLYVDGDLKPLEIGLQGMLVGEVEYHGRSAKLPQAGSEKKAERRRAAEGEAFAHNGNSVVTLHMRIL